jgi:hypothetical protein
MTKLLDYGVQRPQVAVYVVEDGDARSHGGALSKASEDRHRLDMGRVRKHVHRL